RGRFAPGNREPATGNVFWPTFRNKHEPAMSDRPLVLIADDDDDVVQLLKIYLRPLDCDFVQAKDGDEALAIAQTRLPAVVLLDVMMPKRSGWEGCQGLIAPARKAQI